MFVVVFVQEVASWLRVSGILATPAKMKSMHCAFLAQVTLLTPLTLVTKVVISVDVDVDELPDPPPPQDTNIAAEPRNTLNTRPVLENTLRETLLHVSLSDSIDFNFIFIPWALFSIR